MEPPLVSGGLRSDFNAQTMFDLEEPLAFFITFRCYGTWLHGDERGSVDRNNNVYGTPTIPGNKKWPDVSVANLKHPPVNLDLHMRRSVEFAIIDTCKRREWDRYALNVRTNHAHVVLRAPRTSASKVLHALKANATRQMREDGCWTGGHSPWSDRGSKRKLWNKGAVDAAIDYVLYGQGDELPDFD